MLSSLASLRQHREKYCRYRPQMKAKRQVKALAKVPAEIDDDDEYWGEGDESYVYRTKVSVNGRVRDYEMIPTGDVVDVKRWLLNEEALVKYLFDKMKDFLVRGRMVLKAWFVKRNNATFEVMRREIVYLSSLPANLVHDFHHWYNSHVIGIIKNLENFCKQDSDLDFDGVESLAINLNLLPNLSGRAFFQLPDKLKRIKAVVNVDSDKNCFKYALLSILHYGDIKVNRNRPSNYTQWLGELDFGEVNPSDVSIKCVSKIEKLNNLKINIYV